MRYYLLSLGYVVGCLSAAYARDEASSLRPPRAELVPSFWEQHGWQILLALAVALGGILIWVKWLRRPDPAIITPPGVIARSALELLRGRVEDAGLVAEVSRVLRRYVIASFCLPPEELTTSELEKALQSHAQATPELAAGIIAFLRRCDEAKFAPVPSASHLGAVASALDLLEKIGTDRKGAAIILETQAP